MVGRWEVSIVVSFIFHIFDIRFIQLIIKENLLSIKFFKKVLYEMSEFQIKREKKTIKKS